MFPSVQTTGTDNSPQLMHMTSVTLRTLFPLPASKPSSSEGEESSNVEGQETRERMQETQTQALINTPRRTGRG